MIVNLLLTFLLSHNKLAPNTYKEKVTINIGNNIGIGR